MKLTLSIDILDEKLGFGKYASYTIKEILVKDISYIEWLLESNDSTASFYELLLKLKAIRADNRHAYIDTHYDYYYKQEMNPTEQVDPIKIVKDEIAGLLLNGELLRQTKNEIRRWHVVSYDVTETEERLTAYIDDIVEYPLLLVYETYKDASSAVTLYIRKAGKEVEITTEEQKLKQIAFEIKKSIGAIKINQEHVLEEHDFMIRATSFCCMKPGHSVRNIDAVIPILDKELNVRKIKVMAGQCPKCNSFFIMENTYQQVKKEGTILCELITEKAYYSEEVDSFSFNDDSPLSRHGYNVNGNDNLSDGEREAILAYLIDNQILSKAEVISYLRSFIKNHSYSNNYVAISKWEADMAFVEGYKLGSFEAYSVTGLERIDRKVAQ